MPIIPDPQPGEMWTTGQGRTVEIVTRDTVEVYDAFGYPMGFEADVIAYRFLGGSMIHLRAVFPLTNWTKVSFE
jgi:hypothetical protein